MKDLVYGGQYDQFSFIIQQRTDGSVDDLLLAFLRDHRLRAIADAENFVFFWYISVLLCRKNHFVHAVPPL